MWKKSLHGFSSIAFAVFGAMFLVSAEAADIHNEKHKFFFSGEIRAGDAERFAVLVARLPVVSNVTINTSGGDVGEAIRLAELVKGLHIDVLVQKGGYCVSACFFIFLEGYYRVASWAQDDGTLIPSDRRANWPGPIGIHRPYLSSTGGDVRSIKRQEEIMRRIRSYLNVKALPQHLVDEMMARPSNDIYWLTKRDLMLIGDYGPGVEEALVARCGYKRFHQSDAEGWSKERYQALAHCAFEHWDEQYVPLQRAFIARLKAGWRPWNGR